MRQGDQGPGPADARAAVDDDRLGAFSRMQVFDQAVQGLGLLRDSVVRPGHVMIVLDCPALVAEPQVQGPDDVAAFPGLLQDPKPEASDLHGALPVRPVKLALPLFINYNLALLRTAKHKNALNLVDPDHFPEILNRVRQGPLGRDVLAGLAGQKRASHPAGINELRQTDRISQVCLIFTHKNIWIAIELNGLPSIRSEQRRVLVLLEELIDQLCRFYVELTSNRVLSRFGKSAQTLAFFVLHEGRPVEVLEGEVRQGLKRA